MKKLKLMLFILVFLCALVGCAKYPDNPDPSGNQIIIEFSVAGKFNTTDPFDSKINRYYFIAIDCDNVETTYPLPVVGSVANYGWGNGWGTSTKAAESIGITSYVRLDTNNNPSNFYQFIPGSKLLVSGPPIIPISTELINNGRTWRVILDYSQIATLLVTKENIKNLQINFITTNQIPTDPNNPAPLRKWDALGEKNSNEYINITDMTRSFTYTGKDLTGDVSDPDLDITDWQIEINYLNPY